MEESKVKKVELKDLKQYIHSLENGNFDGWDSESVKGYKTACISISKYADQFQSHITKLETDKEERNKILIHLGQSIKLLMKNHAELEARNKELEEALQKIIKRADYGHLEHNRPFKEIAEQALNKK